MHRPSELLSRGGTGARVTDRDDWGPAMDDLFMSGEDEEAQGPGAPRAQARSRGCLVLVVLLPLLSRFLWWFLRAPPARTGFDDHV